MKKICFGLMAATLGLMTVSCSKKEPVEPATSANSTLNVSPFKIPRTPGLIVPMGPLTVGDRWETATQFDLRTGQGSGFVQFEVVLGRVLERRNGIQTGSYSYVSADANYIEVADLTTRTFVRLPRTSPGKYANYLLLNRANSVWEPSFSQVLFAPISACYNDTQAPVFNSNLCTYRSYKVTCNVVNSSRSVYPSALGNYTGFMMSAYKVTDNCDGDLTIKQTPDPSTIITSPTTVFVNFEITDNNNNKLILDLPVRLLKH